MGKIKKIIKSKKLDIDKVTELVSNNENFARYCTLINYGENDFNENDNQGIIIIQKHFLIIIKMQGYDAE